MNLKFILLFCYVTIGYFVSLACQAKTPGEVMVGSFLRDVKMNGLNVNDKSLKSYQGKPLIINVWASWCGPCKAEMSSLEILAKKQNHSFNLIGISTDDYPERALKLIKQTSITFDNYIDKKLVLENMLGANRIPLTILIDKDGKVLKKFRGAMKWDHPLMIKMIDSIFSEEKNKTIHKLN